MSTPHPELARADWRKSTYSASSGDCVEVAPLHNGHRALRDSKNPTGPALTCTSADWVTFTTGIRNDEFA